MLKVLLTFLSILSIFSATLSDTYSAGSRADDRITYTYFILDTCSGDIKIGKSIDINRRFREFRTANIHIKLIGYIASDVEKKLHKKFKDDNVQLEWFDLDIEDLKDIKGIKFINEKMN